MKLGMNNNILRKDISANNILRKEDLYSFYRITVSEIYIF